MVITTLLSTFLHLVACNCTCAWRGICLCVELISPSVICSRVVINDYLSHLCVRSTDSTWAGPSAFALWMALPWTWECKYLIHTRIPNFLGKLSEVWLLNHIVLTFFNFWRISMLLSIMEILIYSYHLWQVFRFLKNTCDLLACCYSPFSCMWNIGSVWFWFSFLFYSRNTFSCIHSAIWSLLLRNIYPWPSQSLIVCFLFSKLFDYFPCFGY